MLFGSGIGGSRLQYHEAVMRGLANFSLGSCNRQPFCSEIPNVV